MMEGDRADVTGLLNHLEVQLQLQDVVISKLQKEQYSSQAWQVRHGNFDGNASANEHHSMHTSLNVSFNEKVKKKLSQNEDLCRHSKHGPMCYLERLVQSQCAARCRNSAQLQNASKTCYKAIIVREVSQRKQAEELKKTDSAIFSILHQRNQLKEELETISKKNKTLNAKLDFIKAAPQRVKTTKELITRLLEHRKEIQKDLKQHCHDIYNKELKLQKNKNEALALKVKLDHKKDETLRAVEVLGGVFGRQAEGQRLDIEEMLGSLKWLEAENLNLFNQIQVHEKLKASAVSSKSPTTSSIFSPITKLPQSSSPSFIHPSSIVPSSTTNHSFNTMVPNKKFTNHLTTNHTAPYSFSYSSSSSIPPHTPSFSQTSVSKLTDFSVTTKPLVTTHVGSLATESISTVNTDIQSVIESMQETIMFLEKEFNNENDEGGTRKATPVATSAARHTTSHLAKTADFVSKSFSTTPTTTTSTPATIPTTTISALATITTTTTTCKSVTTTAPTAQHPTTQNFSSIFKTSLKPLSIKINPPINQATNRTSQFNATTISPSKPHSFSSKPQRLITISSPLKPPAHLLPPTKSSS